MAESQSIKNEINSVSLTPTYTTISLWTLATRQSSCLPTLSLLFCKEIQLFHLPQHSTGDSALPWMWHMQQFTACHTVYKAAVYPHSDFCYWFYGKWSTVLHHSELLRFIDNTRLSKLARTQRWQWRQRTHNDPFNPSLPLSPFLIGRILCSPNILTTVRRTINF